MPGPERRCVVAVDSSGIGDVIVGASVVAGLRQECARHRIVFAVREECLEWARLFCDATETRRLQDVDWGGVIYWPGRAHGQSEIPEAGRRTRHEYYADAAGVVPALPTLCLDEGARTWAGSTLGEGARHVIVAPFAGYHGRAWPVNYFCDLVDLLKERGATPVIIDGPGDGHRSGGFGASHLWGHAPQYVAALMERAAAFVGNDSGMAHVAGAVGIPGVAVCGATRGASVFGFYPRMKAVQATLPCAACYWRPERGYRAACDIMCAALLQLPVERVWVALDAVLASRGEAAAAG